jgi:predicted permease
LTKPQQAGLLRRVLALPPANRVLMLRKILTYPPLLWGVVGISLNLAGFDPACLPDVFYSSLKRVGDTTTTVPLIAMGLLTNLSALRGVEGGNKVRLLAKVLALRVLPTMAMFAYVYATDLGNSAYARTMVLGMIMPVPFVAIPYANDLGYDATFAAVAVVSSTLLSFVLVMVHVWLSA